MARLNRKNTSGDNNESGSTNEMSEPQVNEVGVTEVTSVPNQATVSDGADEASSTDDDFDDLMASFTSDAANETAEGENSEMAKQHDEVQNTEAISDAEMAELNATITDVDPTESALSDAAKEIADKATGRAVEMLPIESIPPTAFIVSNNLNGLNATAEMIKAAVEEFTAGTAGSDEKIKHAISTLTEESDPKGYALREKIAAAKARIAELEEMIEAEEPTLYANVEERLAKEGDVIWSEETKSEKREYIVAMYSAYSDMHKATTQFIESHRSHKPADKVGTIDQYHTKLDKPFKRVGSTSTGVRKSSGAPRNVSVSDARISYDGGATWSRAEGKLKEDGPILSNPAFLAAEIARVSKESGNDIKGRLYSEWYGFNGSADGTPIDANDVQDVSEFDFKYVAKDGSDAVAKIRLTKKGSTIDA